MTSNLNIKKHSLKHCTRTLAAQLSLTIYELSNCPCFFKLSPLHIILLISYLHTMTEEVPSTCWSLRHTNKTEMKWWLIRWRLYPHFFAMCNQFNPSSLSQNCKPRCLYNFISKLLASTLYTCTIGSPVNSKSVKIHEGNNF